MRRALLAAVGAAVLTVLLAAPASAQPLLLEATPADGQARHYPIGTWSEYQVRVDGIKKYRLRAALVARTDDGRETFEQAFIPGTERTPVFTVRIIVANPIGFPRRLVEMAYTVRGMGPVEMHEPDRQRQEQVAPPLPSLGMTVITVPAGQFQVEHRKTTDATVSGDEWVDFDFGPLGLVRLSGAKKGSGRRPRDAVDIQLAARGSDAQPTVLGPAQKYSPADLGMISMWRSLAESSRRQRPERK